MHVHSHMCSGASFPTYLKCCCRKAISTKGLVSEISNASSRDLEYFLHHFSLYNIVSYVHAFIQDTRRVDWLIAR